ncbi:rho family-interacting cell polarization regulator 1-like isoform X2 [Nelusetta ayraudi]|uniref:rho family-interacting cell polarization regulator 1-like isoform X2 n=1 Tax=Nelusetta ayraudi TaxID=303726 RepID=UPI003F6EFD1E
MSLSIRPHTSKPVSRSQSFTAVNTSDKASRNFPVFSTPGPRRKPGRVSRMFSTSVKSNPHPKIPRPERLDEIYMALKKGIQDYLQAYQLDLDNCSRQMKGSKRNSRLGFFYDLDKQVKVTERHIRRLEFHLSKIEELYESYCLQKRLRDGASKMVKAYTSSAGSKEARESLAEASKGHKEYTEEMCVLENELENHLGEFHIKMKGLVGFARLCAGDHYEVLIRYGRQRWRLRGKVEINAKQEWDNEEIVFVPLINEYFSVKVTELKALTNHVVVGNVSCETKDLFAALPQMVALDINDLGTIKLSLEVKWIPFDTEEPGPVATSFNKTASKRLSAIFNHNSPETSSLREQAFYMALLNPEIQPAGMGTSFSQPNIPFCVRESSDFTLDETLDVNSQSSDSSREQVMCTREKDKGTFTSLTELENDERQTPIVTPEVVKMPNNASKICSRSLSHISEGSTGGIVMADEPVGELLEVKHSTSRLSISDSEQLSKTPELHFLAATADDSSSQMIFASNQNTSHDSANIQQENDKIQDDFSSVLEPCKSLNSDLHSQEQTNTHCHLGSRTPKHEIRCASVENLIPGAGANEHDSPVDSDLEEALGNVVSSLADYRGQFPELHLLENELKLLLVLLKGRKRNLSLSMASLSVETALGSFDFLNSSDLEEEDEENTQQDENGSSRQDTPSFPTSQLSTGCRSLDCALVVHLKKCSSQLLRLGTAGPLRCGEMFALDALSRELGLFKIIRNLTEDNPNSQRHPSEVIPELAQCQGAASLWQQCVGPGSVYSVSAQSFMATLSSLYSTMMTERADVTAETVSLRLVEKMLNDRFPQQSSRDVPVTIFQLWTYLEANKVTDVEKHISELAKEVGLVQSLASCDPDVVAAALQRCSRCSLKREGLHAVSKLLTDPRGKVSVLASAVLRSVATQPRLRVQALVNCLELLEDDNTDIRICGCKALACIKIRRKCATLPSRHC